MNQFVKNLNRLEFIITLACTGRCIHCQEGDHDGMHSFIDVSKAIDAIKKIKANYSIESVMTFGGEALLKPEIVYEIHKLSTSLGIKTRQLITNGYFTNDPTKIKEVVKNLKASGVNDVLLSVDAFHQETIPLEPVLLFASEAKAIDLPIRLSPVWVKSNNDDNLYNDKTKEIIDHFKHLNLEVGTDTLFPSGNALKYLKEYFNDETESTPYDEDPLNIKAISFSPDGIVLDESYYEKDILDILNDYNPLRGDNK